MTDDFAPAAIAFGSYHMDRTLEAVEDVHFVFEPDLERFVVVVSAMFTLGHKSFAPFLHSVLARFHLCSERNDNLYRLKRAKVRRERCCWQFDQIGLDMLHDAL